MELTIERIIPAIDTEENLKQLTKLPISTLHQFPVFKVHPLNSIFLDVVDWAYRNEFNLFIDAKLCDIPESIVRFVDYLAQFKPKYITTVYNDLGTENSIEAVLNQCTKYDITPVVVLKLTSSIVLNLNYFVESIEVLSQIGVKHFVVPVQLMSGLIGFSSCVFFTPGVCDLSQVSILSSNQFIISGRTFFKNLSVFK